MNWWPSHSTSALVQADYQEPDCFPEQQAAINDGPHLSPSSAMILIRHGADVPRPVPTSGVPSWCRCGIIHLRPFHSGPGVEAPALGSDPGTLLGSLGSSICATAPDLNKKLHSNEPHRLQKQASPEFERKKIGSLSFKSNYYFFLNATRFK